MLYFAQIILIWSDVLSVNENINAIKEELSTEEKFLESIIKSETFFKKNKKLIFLALSAIIIWIFASIGYNYIKEKNLQESNQIYTKLLKNDNPSLEKELKEKNLSLYTLYSFQKAVKSNDASKLKALLPSLKDPILKDLANYQSTSLTKKDLMIYVGNDGIYKDLALLQEAFMKLENKEYAKAKEILNLIPMNSSLYQLANSLKHYNPKEK